MLNVCFGMDFCPSDEENGLNEPEQTCSKVNPKIDGPTPSDGQSLGFDQQSYIKDTK